MQTRFVVRDSDLVLWNPPAKLEDSYNKFYISSGFWNCLPFSRWVSGCYSEDLRAIPTEYSAPSEFIIDIWFSDDGIKWANVISNKFNNVVWHGEVVHSDPWNADCCTGSIYFNCSGITQVNECSGILTAPRAKLANRDFIKLVKDFVI
jgi:hypothetical protein